jgi:diguanylate cyclase (GGDEF)-like protein
MFFDMLGQAVERARRQKFLLAVLFLDLDGFKQANDTYGHAYGDLVLTESAVRIQGALRSSDTVARVGGDEFAVILEALVEPLEMEKLAARLRKALAEPYVFGGNQATITASIGLAVFPEDGEDADVLVNSADQNMYKAKQALYASR